MKFEKPELEIFTITDDVITTSDMGITGPSNWATVEDSTNE